MRQKIVAALCLLIVSAPVMAAAQVPGLERNQIAAGFDQAQLEAIAGAGGDPGPADPRARLNWAIATAIPAGWRAVVPVKWLIQDLRAGALALTFYDGTTIISPRLLSRSPEELLATVAHEMGHQIAISLVPPLDGTPPRSFVEFAPVRGFNSPDEAWADCVSRVWTGSVQHTRSEPRACSNQAADFVAGLLGDLERLRKIVPVVPSPAPAPVPVLVPSPDPSPLIVPEVLASPSPVPSPSPTRVLAAPASKKSRGYGMWIWGVGLLALVVPALVAMKLVPVNDVSISAKEEGPRPPR